MPVKFVELISIEAKRFSKKGEKVGKVRIDNNSTVTLVSQLSEKEANIDFRYTANYGGIGIIRIEGKMTYGTKQNIEKEWRNSKGKLPPDVASDIHTAIMRTCIPEAVTVSKDIHLPPPIPLPRVNVQKKKKTFGPEVA